MSFSLRRYSFVGNLTRDPEMYQTQSGRKYGKVNICVNESFKTKEGFKNKATYFQVAIFDEYILKRLGKHQRGDLVYTEGEIVPGSYTNKAGDKVYTTSFVAKSFIGPGLKDRVPKNSSDTLPDSYKPETTGDGRVVSADEVEEIFSELDI